MSHTAITSRTQVAVVHPGTATGDTVSDPAWSKLRRNAPVRRTALRPRLPNQEHHAKLSLGITGLSG